MQGIRFLTGVSLAVVFMSLFGACRPTPTSVDATPTLAELPPDWTKIEPGGDTRCARNTPYAYWVRPGTTNKLFVYFQVGGGCYSAETCGLIGSYKDKVNDHHQRWWLLDIAPRRCDLG